MYCSEGGYLEMTLQNELIEQRKGIILTSINGKKFILSVDDIGNLIVKEFSILQNKVILE